jgi:hypothetical protein
MTHDRLPPWSQLSVRINEQVAILFRQKEARGDRIDPDAWTVFLRHMHCQPLGEVGYCCLGRAIGWYAGQRPKRIHGGHIHDTALAACSHAASKHLAALERASKIQTEDAIDRLHIQVKEGLLGCRGGLRMVTSGCVDQNINRTEGARDLLQGSLKGEAIKHITGDSKGPARAFLDCLSHRSRRLSVEADNGDLDASLCQGMSPGAHKLTAAPSNHGGEAAHIEECLWIHHGTNQILSCRRASSASAVRKTRIKSGKATSGSSISGCQRFSHSNAIHP